MEINLLDRLPQTPRDTTARGAAKTEADRAIARRFGEEFFDGDRRYGYGGYRYDGRWVAVAGRLIEHYGLGARARVLDVGCAKGFLLHDLKTLLPEATVRGLEVSAYAKAHAHGQMGPRIDLGSADALPYPDQSFDLAVSINTIHNLPDGRCRRALGELGRVSARQFVTVDAWRTEEEHQRLLDWLLTAESYHHVDDWRRIFVQAGYAGDFWWFIP
jgi:SAM-dependent methyltransferase